MPRADDILLAQALKELERREERKRQTGPAGLMAFIEYFWPLLEPGRTFVKGWVIDGLCLHLESVTSGEIKRLLANVSPGSMKSLILNVFWPAWEWGPMNMPNTRYVAFSYSAHLTERDNEKFRDLVRSAAYQDLWGDRVRLTSEGKIKISNDATGWKFASSVGGVGTGERGDRVLIDDPHNVKEAESEAVRTSTVNWFNESVQNRLNSISDDAIIVIMQRVNEADVSGEIINNYPNFVHYMVPMEYDPGRHCETSIGWSDPRTYQGELAWPERFPADDLQVFKRQPFVWSSQYQQSPEPRGGAIIKRDYWQVWDEESMLQNDVTPPYFPPFEFVVAAFDGAYTENTQNDPSALLVMGIFIENLLDPLTRRHTLANPKIMLIDAWSKWLPLHGPSPGNRAYGETKEDYKDRAQKNWGVVEWIEHTCKKWKVDKLLIENKATGITASQEIRRLFSDSAWGVQLIDTGKLDKISRVHAALSLFVDRMVYAPLTDWADHVINQAAVFPYGAHDDEVDCLAMILNYVRKAGLALRADEARDIRQEMLMPSQPVRRDKTMGYFR